MSQINDIWNDFFTAVIPNIVDKAFVQLQNVDSYIFKHHHRRITGSKIIHQDFDANFMQCFDNIIHNTDIFKKGTFHQLQLYISSRQTASIQNTDIFVNNMRIIQAHPRHIDWYWHRYKPLFKPTHLLATDEFEHITVNLIDKSITFKKRHKLIGRNNNTVTSAPAY